MTPALTITFSPRITNLMWVGLPSFSMTGGGTLMRRDLASLSSMTLMTNSLVPGFQNHGICKHGKAVEIIMLYHMEKNDDVEQVRLREPLSLCRKCKSSNVRKDGTRSKKYRWPAQHYKCAMCKARFSDDIGFAGRHYLPSAYCLRCIPWA